MPQAAGARAVQGLVGHRTPRPRVEAANLNLYQQSHTAALDEPRKAWPLPSPPPSWAAAMSQAAGARAAQGLGGHRLPQPEVGIAEQDLCRHPHDPHHDLHHQRAQQTLGLLARYCLGKRQTQGL